MLKLKRREELTKAALTLEKDLTPTGGVLPIIEAILAEPGNLSREEQLYLLYRIGYVRGYKNRVL